MKNRKNIAALLLALAMMAVTACSSLEGTDGAGGNARQAENVSVMSVADVPEYSGEPYVAINGNEPSFTEEEMTAQSYETYSDLDSLGRCGVVEASVGKDLMPTEKRGSISSVKPSGWINVKYDHVDGKYLYNRCHLIGFQLTAENANEKNLITGTRYMNVDGMLPFENMVADYVKETGNHVMYRVTPIFEGNNLVASGVEMEAKSVEDDGEGVSFHVYVYNVQPKVEIDYATGKSWESDKNREEAGEAEETTYILNTNNMKFHKPDCSSVKEAKEKNKEEFRGKRSELIQKGYEPCKRCKP